ncbi:hypothetical protein CT19431_60168 [Cupriavidus taiwanensis]|nr:hypothetical protein CT19431_60168 [Cupriavidus taiwanensis]
MITHGGDCSKRRPRSGRPVAGPDVLIRARRRRPPPVAAGRPRHGSAALADVTAIGAFGAAVDLVQGVRATLRAGLAGAHAGRAGWRAGDAGKLLAGRQRRSAAVALRQPRGQRRHRHLAAVGVQEAALDQDPLQRIAQRRHLGVMEARHLGAVLAHQRAVAHRALVPHHIAHVGQRLGHRTARARHHRQQPHGRGDPLLALAALPRRHEELHRALDLHRLAIDHAGDAHEVHGQVDGLVALVGQVFDLGRHSLQVAHRPAAERAHQRVVVGRRRRRRGGCLHRQHGPQHRVRPVGRQPLQPGLPGFQVQVAEGFVRIVLWHVDGLADAGVDIRLHRFEHPHMVQRRHLQRGDERLRQLRHVGPHVTVEPPGMVRHLEAAIAVVRHALPAVVGPREGGFDAVRRIVGKGQRDGAGGSDRQQVGVAQPMAADGLAHGLRQPAGEAAAQVGLGIEQGEGALLRRQFGRCQVGFVAHAFRDPRRQLPRRLGVVAQPQHHQRAAQPQEAQPDAALGVGLGLLFGQRPEGHVEHVVEHARRHAHHLGEGVEVERRLRRERLAHEAGQVDRTQAAAAIGWQRLLGARVGGLDALAVIEVVVRVDLRQEQDARLRMIIGGLHDLVPQVARRHAPVHPLPVVAAVRAGGDHVRARLGLVHQLDLGVGLHRLHEVVGNADGDVEVAELALVLGVDKALDIGMVAAQYAHLRTAARARRFHRGARGVEHLHERHRPRRTRMRGPHQRPGRADRREVIAHAAAAAHGFGGLRHGGVDAGAPIARLRHRIAHRLHEAVDQRRLDASARCRIDAPGRHEAVFLGPQEARAPGLALVLGLGLRQRARHALPDIGNAALFALGVFFEQDFGGDFLRRQRAANDLVVCVHVLAHHVCGLVNGRASAARIACARSTRRHGAGNDPRPPRAFDANSARARALGYNAARTGLLAWWRGQPGQVGNEAATAVFRQCRGSGSSTLHFPSAVSLPSRSIPSASLQPVYHSRQRPAGQSLSL